MKQTIKKTSFYCIIFLFLGICQSVRAKVNIIPQPQCVVEKTGVFKMNPSTRILLRQPNVEIERVAGVLTGRVAGIFDMVIKPANNMPQSKDLICFSENKSISKEGYRLTITPDGIQIEYAEPVGAFYAVQSLLQMMPPEVYGTEKVACKSVKLPCVEIADAPRFGYRGVMLDVGRHYMPLSYIKQYIDVLAMLKINRFHWHLTEDQGWRIEIKKYPRLTEVASKRAQTCVGSWKDGVYDGKPYGGYYTQEEAKEVVAYARERFITVIPEVDLPGHSVAAITAYPYLSCFPDKEYKVAERWGVFEEVCCPKEETFAFFEDVFRELFEIFPSEVYHVGGDECPKTAWKTCANCQAKIKKEGLKDEEQLQSYFIQRLEKFLNANGKRIIGWDEILEGGLAPNATVMSWRGEKGGLAAARERHEVIMAPNTYLYLDYSPEGEEGDSLSFNRRRFLPLSLVYSYEPMSPQLKPEEQHFIVGVQANVWTEYIKTPDRATYMTFPRAMALAEVGWTIPERKDFTSFAYRLLSMFPRIQVMGMPCDRTFYQPLFHYNRRTTDFPREVEIKAEYPESKVYYTTDGTNPTPKSKEYTQPLFLNKGAVVKAVAYVGNKQIGEMRTLKF